MTTKELAYQLGVTEQEVISIGVENGILNPDGTPTQKGYDLGYFEPTAEMMFDELKKIIAQLTPEQLNQLYNEAIKPELIKLCN